MQVNPLAINDFSGGETDYTVDAAVNKSALLQNFLINPNRKLYVRPGSDIFDPSMYQVPDGLVRIQALISHDNQSSLFINSGRKIWYPGVSSFTELLGPTGNAAFAVNTSSNFTSSAESNKIVIAVSDSYTKPIKIFKNAIGVPQVRTAGLPVLASSPVITAGTAGTTKSYIYAFTQEVSYVVNDTTFLTEGAAVRVVATSANAIGAGAPNTMSIASIPALSNGSTDNYDTANVKINIYRSTDAGTVLYRVGQIANGVTTYSDTTDDATLQNLPTAYFSGSAIENTSPPPAKYIHMVNGKAYYLNVKVGSDFLKNRLIQSLTDVLDGVPPSFFVDFEDEGMGISSYNGRVIVFGLTHTYRIEGEFSNIGQDGMTFEEISTSIGCVSHQSIVQTRDGVFWAGNDGFYWTDGYNVRKVSDSLNETYKTFVDTALKRSRIYGTYDKIDNKVHFAVQRDSTSGDNDSWQTLDLRWGVRSDMVFSHALNGSYFSPTAVCFYRGQLIRADSRGYIFKHDASYVNDPRVDTVKVPSLWGTAAIIYDYKSISSNFGFPNIRKWVARMLLTLQNTSNASVQIYSNNDDSGVERALKPIRFRSNLTWGDPEPIWGNDLIIWGSTGLIEMLRRFPAKTLRCAYKQIRITNAYLDIYRSDSLGNVVIDSALKTATLIGSFSFPDDLLDYKISFESDGYVTDYPITDQTSSSVTFLDIEDNAVSNPNSKFLVRGYPKGEDCRVMSYVLYFYPLTESQRDFDGSAEDTGGNG